MISFLINKVKNYLKLYRHRKHWRAKNRHNKSIASSFFPIDKVTVGKHSYGDLHIISYGEQNEGLYIGHYVSLANDVKFLLGGNHYYNRFTNYPFIAKFENSSFVETWSKGKIVVQDDVWIGTEAFIMPGVTIGKGAIIAARAVVVKDIPPYAIAGGNPARVIKYRFDTVTIEKLMELDFSTLTPENIVANKSLYQAETNLDETIALFKSDRK